MRGVRETCSPRPEVLKGDLEDAIFAADFGHVIAGIEPEVYRNPEVFFRNTYPTAQLKKVVGTVFGRLSDPHESGAAIRLSTGFGGGKTHTLIALYHLARHISQPTLGTELLPAAGRPPHVCVAAVDARHFGTAVCATHGDLQTHSLWCELAYQMGGEEAYRRNAPFDAPDQAPDAGTIRATLPAGPTLLLLDELVIYLAALKPQERRALLSLITSLIAECQARPQTVLVITDTAGQVVYEAEARAIADAAAQIRAAEDLSGILARKVSDFDPIADESSEVINQRLFQRIDRDAAQEASAEYYRAYQRIRTERPEALPALAATKDYAQHVVRCYPFHPRLVATARDRLSALQDFNQTRGVLRLFARVVRDVWEQQRDPYLISAGDLDWSSQRLQADLLSRLSRDRFRTAVDADVRGHARALDEEHNSDIHGRVATALLLESLPLHANAAMDKADLGLATLRPSDAGHEPGEALDRLLGVCWHTYRDETGTRYQFRYEPNANRIIEERAGLIPEEDARSQVLTTVQNHYHGQTFKLIAWPPSPRAVPDLAQLKLVLVETAELGQAVCDHQDAPEDDAPMPRRFRNAILALAPTSDALGEAIAARRRVMAAEQIASEEREKPGAPRKKTPLLEQVEELLPTLRTRARRSALLAFNRVLLQKRPSQTLDERYIVSGDKPLHDVNGQARLMDFLLEAKDRLIYKADEALDVDLLIESAVKGATPSLEHEGAVLASAVHERALASAGLRLMLDEGPVRAAVLRGVRQGMLLVRVPDGTAYDAEGSVTGPHGQRRRRLGERLASLPLTSDLLLAPADAPCVREWLRVDEGGDNGPPEVLTVAEAAALKGVTEEQVREALDLGYLTETWRDGERCVVRDARFRAWQPLKDPPPPRGPVKVHGWEDALRHAETRPLLSVTLQAGDSSSARLLAAVAQPFSAVTLSLTLLAGGELNDGGRLDFMVTGGNPQGALKPLETAERLLRATNDEGRSMSARLTLGFGEAPPRGTRARFEQAQARADGKVQVEATFGVEDDNGW